jgi:hypothetical protein
MSTTITISLLNLPDEYRRQAHRDIDAIRAAIRKVAHEDALRWIQWSIRGGGTGQAIPRTTGTKPRAEKGKAARPKKLKERGAAPKAGKGKDTGSSPQKRPRPKTEPPTYRQPIDTGDYARSFDATDTPNGAVIFSRAKPAIKVGVIEHGRRPAPIPPGVLVDWVRRKLHVKDPKEDLGTAIAISKAAAKKRRPGLKVLARARPKIKDAVHRAVYLAVARARHGGEVGTH